MKLQPQQNLHFHLKSPSKMRVQEEMYGHRLNTDQEGYMILLEALTVINEVPLGTKIPDPKSFSHERIHYTLPYKQRIRYLLFKDQHLAKIINDPLEAKDRKWEIWKDKTKQYFRSLSSLEDHFHYLDEQFDDLDELLQAVRLIQSMELDVMNKRRWTSKFLCITGPDMIIPDFRCEANGNWSIDRRFFGRGGELVYLMLNRSDQCEEVQNIVQKRLFGSNDPYNKIAKSLSPPDSFGTSNTEIGYLPCIKHESYNRLAKAWINILEQELLSGSHFFDPLFRITGLNLFLYLSERAKEITDSPYVEPILIDLTNGTNYELRQAAKNNLNLHRILQNDAVKSFITNKIESDNDWETACFLKDGIKAAEVINKLFDYNVDNKSYDGLSHDEVLKSFINKAQRRNHNNAHRYILSLSKQIGLCTSRGSLGTWFAMDDLMIIALVMAEVVDTVELGEFLAKIYNTYNLVIGPTEARKAYSKIPISNKCFEENLTAMEKRMTKLALTKRLSDDCAFVINPFRSPNA